MAGVCRVCSCPYRWVAVNLTLAQGVVGGILLLRFLMLEPRSVVLTGNVTSGFTVGIFVPWGLGQGSEVIPEIKQKGGLSRHQSWGHTGQC